MIVYDTPSRPAVFGPAVWRALGMEMARVLRYRHPRRVGLRWATPEEMRRLNAAYRKKDRPTDVLSFEPDRSLGEEAGYMGDLVVCPAYAQEEARRRGIPLKEELLRLIVHGTLHLAGYDHATLDDESRMFGVQERTISRILDICPLRS